MGHLSRVLGRLIDPVEESRRAAAVLGDEQYVLEVEPAGDRPRGKTEPRVHVIRPRSDYAREDLVTYFDGLINVILESTGRWWTTQFFWDGAPSQWYRCRCVRRHDGAVVVGISPLERLPYGLSKRELEVLTLVADGAKNDGIAARLFVTTRTAKAHIEHILEKLDVSSRSAATMKAMEEGILLRPPQISLPPGGAGGEPWPLAALRGRGEGSREPADKAMRA
jgi:DNA-binding CsgD family transcriptional regulator